MARRVIGWEKSRVCVTCDQEATFFYPTRTDLNCYCSPLCKAMGMVNFDTSHIDPDKCIPYKHPMFIWHHSSYSVKTLIHAWFTKKQELARNIVLTCQLQRCANPHHMRVRKVRPAIIDSDPLRDFEGE